MSDDEFLNAPENFFEFLSVAAKFSATRPLGDYATQLSHPYIAKATAGAVPVLKRLWRGAIDRQLGDGLAGLVLNGRPLFVGFSSHQLVTKL